MRYLSLMDYDKTLIDDNGNISKLSNEILHDYLLENKLCIISYEAYDNLYKFINKYELKCDIASISSSKMLINNKVYESMIDGIVIIDLINKFKNHIYTAYTEDLNYSYIYNYQERLKSLYPKKEAKDISLLDKCNNITISIYNEYLNEFINNLGNLEYKIIISDKAKTLLVLSSISISKESVFNYLIDNYKGYKTIGITDSSSDLDMIKNCDIKIAMINGDSILKSNVNYITIYDNNHDGACIMLKKVISL